MVGTIHYDVTAPFRVWRHVGHSPSNRWIGSTRLVNTVRHALNLRPGDRLHIHPTGHVTTMRDGGAWVVSLREPPPYGRRQASVRPERMAESLAAAGLLVPAASDPGSPDLEAALLAVSSNLLPPLHAETVEIERSPELERLLSAAASAASAIHGAEARTSWMDSGHHGPAEVVVEAGDARLRLLAYPGHVTRAFLPDGDIWDGPVTHVGPDGSYLDVPASEASRTVREILAALASSRGLAPAP